MYEIERKFLLKNEGWRENWESTPTRLSANIQQGYLHIGPESSTRVLTVNKITHLGREPETFFQRKTGWLGVKIGKGLSRVEVERVITLPEADKLFEHCVGNIISKNRYYVGKWEIDIFDSGLVLAEIELKTEDEEIDLPDWIGEEVTGVSKYYNANMV